MRCELKMDTSKVMTWPTGPRSGVQNETRIYRGCELKMDRVETGEDSREREAPAAFMIE